MPFQQDGVKIAANDLTLLWLIPSTKFSKFLSYGKVDTVVRRVGLRTWTSDDIIHHLIETFHLILDS